MTKTGKESLFAHNSLMTDLGSIMIRLLRTGVGVQGHTPSRGQNCPTQKDLNSVGPGGCRFCLFDDEIHPGGGPPIVLSRKNCSTGMRLEAVPYGKQVDGGPRTLSTPFKTSAGIPIC